MQKSLLPHFSRSPAMGDTQLGRQAAACIYIAVRKVSGLLSCDAMLARYMRRPEQTVVLPPHALIIQYPLYPFHSIILVI